MTQECFNIAIFRLRAGDPFLGEINRKITTGKTFRIGQDFFDLCEIDR